MEKGIAASKGYAIGQVVIKHNKVVDVVEKKIEDVKSEVDRFESVLLEARSQITTIKDKASVDLGADKAEVFESHLMLLDDPEFSGTVIEKIQDEKINAEKSVKDVVDGYLKIFANMDNEYMKERAADIRDVGGRLLSILSGASNESLLNIPENSIVVAHDLTPSDTAQLDRTKVIAFLTDIGGRTSHSAIMARTLEIPAVVGMNDVTTSVKSGDTVIVDGTEGIVIINPTQDEIEEYTAKKITYENEKEKLKTLINTKTVTKEGKRIEVAGNIGNPKDVNKVLENGGDGIGLFRTEFLYMDRKNLPTEEEQFESYKYVLEKMENRPVVIRTLDIGGDKKLEYLPMPAEMNPFLGYRAIRICLDRIDIFKVQLRALLRASVYGNLRIMFPMISSLSEFISAKDILEKCKMELELEGKNFSESIQVGIMIEIPAAAVMADEFAKYVDFFSIGTNDLIQYTLAADRMNEKVSYLYNPMHPAVLRLIKMTIEAAHNEGKWCGMCGEMAGDERAVSKLLEFGLDEFSMSASSMLRAKQLIINN
jgi:phosphoenolpyruvate-protein phosphotransferase (PTS system enzyme I)